MHVGFRQPGGTNIPARMTRVLTSDTTLTLADHETNISNAGATIPVTYTLPPASSSVGARMYFFKESGQDMIISAPGTDVIQPDIVNNEVHEGGVIKNTTADVAVDAAIQEDAAPAGFVDETTDANDAGADDVDMFPATSAVGDNFYIGSSDMFSYAVIDVGTAATPAGGVLSWEYYNGSWVDLSGDAATSNDANNLITTGPRDINFTFPTDWTTTTINSQGPYYYIRANVTTIYTTEPVADQVWVNKGEVGASCILECFNSTTWGLVGGFGTWETAAS